MIISPLTTNQFSHLSTLDYVIGAGLINSGKAVAKIGKIWDVDLRMDAQEFGRPVRAVYSFRGDLTLGACKVKFRSFHDDSSSILEARDLIISDLMEKFGSTQHHHQDSAGQFLVWNCKEGYRIARLELRRGEGAQEMLETEVDRFYPMQH